MRIYLISNLWRFFWWTFQYYRLIYLNLGVAIKPLVLACVHFVCTSLCPTGNQHHIETTYRLHSELYWPLFHGKYQRVPAGLSALRILHSRPVRPRSVRCQSGYVLWELQSGRGMFLSYIICVLNWIDAADHTNLQCYCVGFNTDILSYNECVTNCLFHWKLNLDICDSDFEVSEVHVEDSCYALGIQATADTRDALIRHWLIIGRPVIGAC